LAQLFLTGALLHAGQDTRRSGWLRRSLDASIEALASARGARLAEPPAVSSMACFSAAARVQEVELPGDAEWLPESVLITVVQREPGQLCLRGSSGKLLSTVLVVHEPVAGERDLRALVLVRTVRRAVAAYRAALEMSRVQLEAALAELTLHPRLGSVADKAARLPELARGVALALGAPELAPEARLVAERCKLDLGTPMVRSAPDLQGLVGQGWCVSHGDSEEVAAAVASHLRPRDDAQLPAEDLLGALVGIADRIDTLACAFLHGLAPTPSHDPLQLRCHTYELVRTLLAHDLRVDLRHLASLAMKQQSTHGVWLSPEDATIRMTGFLRHRLKVLLSRSFAAEEVHGALSMEPLCPASALALLGSS
jgi:glycyl-tRNA synthetase beta chain